MKLKSRNTWSRFCTWTLPALAASALLWIGCGGGGSGGGGSTSLLHAEVVVSGLAYPTSLCFAPDGRMFVTEKTTGSIRIIDNGVLLPAPFATLDNNDDGERGLLSVVLDPDFTNNGYVYCFHTKSSGTTNEVVRFTANGNVGENPAVIVPNLPAANNHDGGRLVFGLDGKLYVTLGDVADAANAQSDSSPAGKVLRYNPDGSIPSDNPISGNPLFTKGHRNCFGICVDPDSGTIFVSENGPNCDDEVNRLSPGQNYGWRPSQPCNDSDPNYTQPIQRFSSIIAPTGITVGSGAYSGSLLMTSYSDRSLRKIDLSDLESGSVTGVTILYQHASNALIDVAMGPDGNLYVAAGDFGGQGSILKLLP